MKTFRKFLAAFLTIAMVISSTLPNLAMEAVNESSETSFAVEETTVEESTVEESTVEATGDGVGASTRPSELLSSESEESATKSPWGTSPEETTKVEETTTTDTTITDETRASISETDLNSLIGRFKQYDKLLGATGYDFDIEAHLYA